MASEQVKWVAVLEDKWEGRFCGGTWIAVARRDVPGNDVTVSRIEEVLTKSQSDDVTASEWAINLPVWVAVGETADDAIHNLEQQLSRKTGMD